MDLRKFVNSTSGELVTISGTDPTLGPWTHKAFVPAPLPDEAPVLSSRTHLRIADARAALSALDSTARRLPNPSLLRRPTLRREAQSTSALEGTYEPLQAVLTADEDAPISLGMREVLNFVSIADRAFDWVHAGRPLSASVVSELQGLLVKGTASEGSASGRLRDTQVVVGRRADGDPLGLPVHAARFVPSPPGNDLRARLEDLLRWISADHRGSIDPVVAAGMAHYQFETLHPFHDGNGRLGRLLIVLQLLINGTLTEPTLTVSPWFEARRSDYYDRLLAVSQEGDWDAWLAFFAAGLQESAVLTQAQMLGLVAVQDQLKDVVRGSSLRADSALVLVDYAVARLAFTVSEVQRDLRLSYNRANGLVSDLVGLELLAPLGSGTYRRRFYAPKVLNVLLSAEPIA